MVFEKPCNYLLSPEEVGEVLGVSPKTLAFWRHKKRYDLKYIKFGNLVRYRWNDVVSFINSMEVKVEDEKD